MKKYIYPAIGVGAFIIGGLIAREKTLEGLEIVENFFDRSEPDTEDQ